MGGAGVGGEKDCKLGLFFFYFLAMVTSCLPFEGMRAQ